jgi:hypothetical protein
MIEVVGSNEPGDLTGDYNSDGAVDAADYVVWRKNNINGQQGYDDWRANFGRTSGPGSGGLAANVPEPAGMSLVTIGGVLFVRRVRRLRAKN